MKITSAHDFAQEALKRQRAESEETRREYEKSGNHEIVIGFIKKSKSGAAILEPWVQGVIRQWVRNDSHELLKAAFLPRRGERSDTRARAKENMMFVERIEKHRRAGQSLNEAFISELNRLGKGELTGETLDKELRSLKNKYHRGKRIKAEITIQETPESFAITAFPAIIRSGDLTVFGEWTYKFLKK